MYVLALGSPALDWAVAKAEGYEAEIASGTDLVIIRRQGVVDYFSPSTNWSWGGPIIERERICIEPSVRDEHYWYARKLGRNGNIYGGMTPLEAAMRCYVASTLGEEVDTPSRWRVPMRATNISIARDFSLKPFGRYPEDGKNNGQRFREDFLLPALRDFDRTTVDLDDLPIELGPSFLDEVFGGLVRINGLTPQLLKERLVVKSEKSGYIDEVWEYVATAAKNAEDSR